MGLRELESVRAERVGIGEGVRLRELESVRAERVGISEGVGLRELESMRAIIQVSQPHSLTDSLNSQGDTFASLGSRV